MRSRPYRRLGFPVGREGASEHDISRIRAATGCRDRKPAEQMGRRPGKCDTVMDVVESSPQRVIND